MRAGKLRHKVTIQTPTAPTDNYGDEITGWTTLAQVWAGLRYLSGQELKRVLAQEETATQGAEWTIRYLSTVDTEKRISWNSRIWDIQAVKTVEERSRKMVLTCTETTPA